MSGNILQKWAVYESNVQQYRVISVTVQSFFLAVGSIWFSATPPPPLIFKIFLFLIGVSHIVFIWMPIVFARLKIVDYYKIQIDLSDEDRRNLASLYTENMYRESETIRIQVREMFPQIKIQNPMRTTRIKLDIVVPIAYFFIWALMLAYALCGCWAQGVDKLVTPCTFCVLCVI